MPHVIKTIILSLADALPDISNILLAVLGVLMSFPAKAEEIERNPAWRKTIAYSCIVVAIAGFAASTYQRRHFNSQIDTLVTDDDKLVKDSDRLITTTDTLVTDTHTMVTSVGILMPNLNALQTRIADLGVKIAAAKERHDPRLVADLQAQAKAAQSEADKATKKILLAMVQSLVDQLGNGKMKWVDEYDNSYHFYYEHIEHVQREGGSKEEIKKIEDAWDKLKEQINGRHRAQMRDVIANANYLREQALQVLPETNDDKTAGGLLGGDFEPRDIDKATAYLRRLAGRLAA